MQYNIGVDIGGTFTDCVVVDDSGRLAMGKAISTPDDFAVGTINAVREAAKSLRIDERALLGATRLFFHGCTVADNTLLTRSGPRTGLITTGGFADTLLMMRGKKTEGLTEAEAAHFSALDKPVPIVPRPLIAEVTERIDYKGAVLISLDLAEAEAAVDGLVAKGVEAIAVCLLWSIANDSHERAIAELIRRKYPKLFGSTSSEVAPFLGEYERTVTTVFNAYIGPTISAYLTNLRAMLGAKGLEREPLIMQAYGGVLGLEASARNAIGMIESGPAAGVVGTQFLANLMGERDALVTDMGGTTFKVSVIRNGKIERNYSPVILRHNILATKIWVESIGAGGGSIAWVDRDTGLLKVGPQGAGAKPGPVCYGLGGMQPTVCDADLILGFLDEDYFLGGRMTLAKEAARRAIEEKVAKPLGLSVLAAASGIYRITNAHMADLVRKATVERGYDPRDFVLFVIGGAGPVHAGRYAAQLGIHQVVIPLTAAVQGALGVITSDVVFEYGQSDRSPLPVELSRVNANFAKLISRGQNDLAAMGFAAQDIRMQRSIDMRYRYQAHELNVPFAVGIAAITADDMTKIDAEFDQLYEQTYGSGSGYREAGKEIVTYRVSARGVIGKPLIEKNEVASGSRVGARKGRRNVFFSELDGFIDTPIYDFRLLRPGFEVAGPAVIESTITTIVVNPGDRARVDEYRNVRLFIGASAADLKFLQR
jgi:N-methylhydantoinase A